MSNMEPNVQEFLQRVMWSIFIGLVWLFINMTAGIFGGWLFFEVRPTVGNIIFYVWLVASLAGLLWLLYRMWRSET
jgi:hypothetical protein